MPIDKVPAVLRLNNLMAVVLRILRDFTSLILLAKLLKLQETLNFN